MVSGERWGRGRGRGRGTCTVGFGDDLCDGVETFVAAADFELDFDEEHCECAAYLELVLNAAARGEAALDHRFGRVLDEQPELRHQAVHQLEWCYASARTARGCGQGVLTGARNLERASSVRCSSGGP